MSSTRRVSLTQDGQLCYDRSLLLLDEYQELESLFQQQSNQVSGVLRLDMSTGMARNVLMPQLPDFMQQYPNIRLELSSTDRKVDLVAEGFDCVIRVGSVDDEGLVAREEALKSAASVIRATPEEVPTRLAALLDERKRLEKELAEAKKALALGGGGSGGAAPAADETVAGVTFSGQVLEGLDAKELRPLLDAAKQRMGSGVAAIIAVNDGKASIAAAVTDDLTARFSAVDLVRAGVEALGGKGGGGRPDMAQGGGPDGSKAADALAAVKAVLAG